MIPFPQPRPSRPPALSPRSSSDLAAESSDIGWPKELPPLPVTPMTMPLPYEPGETSQDSSRIGKGINWWWKKGERQHQDASAKKGREGSSRTSYRIDDLSSSFQRLDTSEDTTKGKHCQIERRDRQRSDNQSHDRSESQSAQPHHLSRRRSPPPPPIPPRPISLDDSYNRIRNSLPPVGYNVSSSPRLHRTYDPPPLQVPDPPLPRPLPHSVPTGALYHPADSSTVSYERSSSHPVDSCQGNYYGEYRHEHRLPHAHTVPNLAQAARTAESHYSNWQAPSAPFQSSLQPSHRTNFYSPQISHAHSHNTKSNSILVRPPVTLASKPATSISHGSQSVRKTPQPVASPASGSQQCSGYTKMGKRCKRMVRAAAPYAVLHQGQIQVTNSLQSAMSKGYLDHHRSGPAGSSFDAQIGEDSPIAEPRYCKDHVKQICEAEGFYWKGNRRDKWIRFADWISEDLEEQSKVLLRLTMESALTSKESPGFIYAYELRDLQTSNTAYYKVGRTDNVPRRIDEWKKRCASHLPTLRDVFPLAHIDGPGQSMLPGAMQGGLGTDSQSIGRRPCQAVKRLERLIHIELAARSATSAIEGVSSRKYACPDCQTMHQEIFPITRIPFHSHEPNAGGWEYEQIVKLVIERWEAFLREIMDD